MASDWTHVLARWVDAGLIDRDSADRIRAWESRRTAHSGFRWPTIVALAFGGLLLGAGVLLFVAAHWDRLSPAQRMTLVVTMVAAFHISGAWLRERFGNLSVTLHAVGTIALGAGIALTGQIFHLEEHWSGGALLWTIGAWIAWGLLRDWVQIVFVALLTPAWIAGEIDKLTAPGYGDCGAGVFVFLTAVTYLSMRRDDDDPPYRRALAMIGNAAYFPAAFFMLMVADGGKNQPPPPTLVWAIALLLPLGFAYWARGQAAWMNALASALVLAIAVAARHNRELPVYILCALASIGLVAWGVTEQRKERINLGIASFALTVCGFFLSNVMDRLDRSASLIVLGLVFLGGGWYLEQLRRRLISKVAA